MSTLAGRSRFFIPLRALLPLGAGLLASCGDSGSKEGEETGSGGTGGDMPLGGRPTDGDGDGDEEPTGGRTSTGGSGDGDGDLIGGAAGDSSSGGGNPGTGGASSGGEPGTGGSMGGDSGTGGSPEMGQCVDEVGRFFLRNDQTAWHIVGTSNPVKTQIAELSDESPLTGVIDIASGTRYGCAVDSEGGAWCWPSDGSPVNVYGELGDNLPSSGPPGGYMRHFATPVLAETGGDPAALSGVLGLQSRSDECTGSTNCAVVSGGALWCWGRGQSGILNSMATGAESRVAVPIESSEGVALTGVDQVSALSAHVCTVSDGIVHCWGSNSSGQLGQGDVVTEAYPQAVELGGLVSQVGVGRDVSCALLRDGTVKCWGSNRFGALGIGDPALDDDGCSFPCKVSPVEVTTGSGPLTDVVDIAVGSRSLNTPGFNDVCALRNDGSIWCWGEVSGTDVATPIQDDQGEPLSDAVQVTLCAGRVRYVTEDDRFFEKNGSLTTELASPCP